jgi:hypothetical protein
MSVGVQQKSPEMFEPFLRILKPQIRLIRRRPALLSLDGTFNEELMTIPIAIKFME